MIIGLSCGDKSLIAIIKYQKVCWDLGFVFWGFFWLNAG
jgi:hypothetical protein